MLEKLFEHPALKPFWKEIEKSPSLLIENLGDTPKAILATLAKKRAGKNILFISGKKEDRLLDSFSFLQEEAFDFLPWETLPGEEIPPSLDISGKRLNILYKIAESKSPLIVLSSIQSLTQKTVAPQTLVPLCRLLKKGEEIAFDTLPDLLVRLGYKRCPVASDKGEFAVRGGLIDLFPISSSQPYRLDFFADTLESIRTYDPIGQKSMQKIDQFFLCPASEWDLLKQEKQPTTLLDYLGPDTLIILDDPLAIEDAYLALKSLPGIDRRLFFSLEDFLETLKQFTHFFFLNEKAERLSDTFLPEKKGRAFYSRKDPFQPIDFEFFTKPLSSIRWNHPFSSITHFFSRFENKEAATCEEILEGVCNSTNSSLELYFVTANQSEENLIKDKAEALHLTFPTQTSFIKGYLASGFLLDHSLACIPTPELTHRYKIRREEWRNSYHTPPSEFHELKSGDTIVHFHSGIGRFLGVTNRPNHLGQDTEYLQLEYAENSNLFVPVSQSHLISRYIGAKEEKPTLHALGSTKWQKTYKEAENAIVGYAQELLQKMAERVVASSFRFPEDSSYMQMFEEEFPFQETEDQLRAIEAIKKDMCDEKAMDRLICGDVGYGKTEVAMRAAFKAVCDGKKQVAVLVPTTILALQHYDTFTVRMANFPVTIAVLSRLCSPKKAQEILKKTKEGAIDILIGTHRLISKDIAFKDLGLLIIDEEQKFGVRAKERLRALKAGVDCLTLSATPIPRTLYMSLIGAKEISEISTPPQDRLPIKSIIAEKDDRLIQNALLREFSREGQAIFVHNRVETLDRLAEQLQKLVPEAKILIGHGQMSADEIDSIFHAFKAGEADLLLATTIVENGVDIPNVNTIFIDRADQFGMADLYQLRGRVGRWNRPAYAYFLIPKSQILLEPARKRLQSLAESSGYGGGMKLALKDLEMRGAGDILGTQQSGQISAIGFHLYCKLLKKAIEALKKQEPIRFMETKMDLSLEAKLPENYINESSLRMEIYYRLGNASSFAEVDEIFKEIEDRFGKAPRQVKLLMLFTRIKIFASCLQIVSLKFERHTFTAEKKALKRTFPLPNLKSLESFEQEVLKLLKEWRPL